MFADLRISFSPRFEFLSHTAWVTSVVFCNRRLPVNFRYALLATKIARRTCQSRREHENYRVSLADQVGEASLPVLATGYAVAVDDTFKAASIEGHIQLVGKVQVVAAAGDEDAKLAPGASRLGSLVAELYYRASAKPDRMHHALCVISRLRM